GLDHVLGAVGQRDKAAFVDPADIAGAQPAVLELIPAILFADVRAGNPRSAHLQLTDGFAVVRELIASVVDDPKLDSCNRTTLGRSQTPPLLGVERRRWTRDSR